MENGPQIFDTEIANSAAGCSILLKFDNLQTTKFNNITADSLKTFKVKDQSHSVT